MHFKIFSGNKWQLWQYSLRSQFKMVSSVEKKNILEKMRKYMDLKFLQLIKGLQRLLKSHFSINDGIHLLHWANPLPTTVSFIATKRICYSVALFVHSLPLLRSNKFHYTTEYGFVVLDIFHFVFWACQIPSETRKKD